MTENDQASATGEQLTPKQELLISLLLAGVNIATAAKQAGVSDKTARRWLKLPAFKHAYRTAQHDLFRESLQALQGKIEKAIDTLDRHMDADETPASSQIRAAQIVLDQALAIDKMSELETIEEKLAMLEQHINVT